MLFSFPGRPLKPPPPAFSAGTSSSAITVVIPDVTSHPALHPVGMYNIEYVSGGRISRVMEVEAEQKWIRIAGLLPRRSYNFRLQAVSYLGESAWSDYAKEDTLAVGMLSCP